MSIHYATCPALLPYSCRVHKEQNDQIQESDAGASGRVSGQNQPCAAVSSMSTILLPGHWCHLAGKGETVRVPFIPTRWHHQCLEFKVGVYQKQELLVFLEFDGCFSQKQEPKALVNLNNNHLPLASSILWGSLTPCRHVLSVHALWYTNTHRYVISPVVHQDSTKPVT